VQWHAREGDRGDLFVEAVEGGKDGRLAVECSFGGVGRVLRSVSWMAMSRSRSAICR
jgi:hypothetical protein